MWSRNRANLYIRDALADFHPDPKALPSPIAQRKIYRNRLMVNHLVGFGGGASVGEQGYSYKFDGTGGAIKITVNNNQISLNYVSAKEMKSEEV